jgi:hypothetical protein
MKYIKFILIVFCVNQVFPADSEGNQVFPADSEGNQVFPLIV